jgi:hypothetical protein
MISLALRCSRDNQIVLACNRELSMAVDQFRRQVRERVKVSRGRN